MTPEFMILDIMTLDFRTLDLVPDTIHIVFSRHSRML